MLITEGGKTIRMSVNSDQFRVMGRATAGVKAIALPTGDKLVSMAWVRPDPDEKAAENAAEGAADEDSAEGATDEDSAEGGDVEDSAEGGEGVPPAGGEEDGKGDTEA